MRNIQGGTDKEMFISIDGILDHLLRKSESMYRKINKRRVLF